MCIIIHIYYRYIITYLYIINNNIISTNLYIILLYSIFNICIIYYYLLYSNIVCIIGRTQKKSEVGSKMVRK
jgi:hypothetical protein